MKAIKHALLLGGLSVLLILFACITINIYFPAEKVESVAGEIVKDIRGKGDNGQKELKKNNGNSLLLKTLVAFGSSYAWAEDVTAVSNAAIRGLKADMKARYPEMKTYYQKGMLAEGDDGYVSLGDTSNLSLKDKRNLKVLVEAENKDRENLYKEVAKALEIDPSQTSKVAEIFAKEWQKSVR